MKNILTTLSLLLCLYLSASSQIIASYIGSGGTSTATTGVPNETVTALQRIGFGANTPCGSGGLSGLTANGFTVYNPSNPRVYFKITPNAGYMLNITGFTAGMRRSNSGIAKVRFAYSLDNGGTWIDDGVDHAPNNGGCGSTAVSAWGGGTLPTGITSTTNGIIIALYPYAPIATGGVIQINTIIINGTVTPACTPPLVYSVTGGGAYCAGGTGVSIGLSNSQVGDDYQLYDGATTVGGTVAGTGAAISFGTFTTAGTYTVLASNAMPACTSNMTGSAVITIDPLPTTITGTTNVCEGATTSLSSTPSGGTWTSLNIAVATADATSGVITGVLAGTATIVYTLPTTCSTTTTVTVLQAPSTIAGLAALCVGDITTLTNTIAGGTWSSSDITIADIGSASGTVTGMAAGTATIVYTLPSGCNSSVVFTVNAMPTAITGTMILCEGLSSILGNSIAGGTWSSGNTTVATTSSPAGTVNGITAGTASITYTLPGSCIATTTVTINPAPSAISGPTDICMGLTAPFTNAIAGGTWSSSNIAVADIGTSTGIASGMSAGTADISYITATCNAVIKTVTINPVAPINGLTNMCVGSATGLNNSLAGGTWTSSNTTVAAIGYYTGFVSPFAAGTSTINYTLTTGCVSSVIITVNSTIPPITGAPVVCEGLSTTLSTISTGGTWTSSNPLIASINASTGLLTGIAAGNAYITYTLLAGCYTTKPITVGMAPAPATIGENVCIGNTVTLTNVVSGGSWTSSNPGIASVNPSSGVVTGLFASTAIISYSTVSCNPSTYIVTVNPLPDTITGNPNVCEGTTTVFGNTSTGGIWSSSSPAVSVTPSGLVTGVSAGVYADITYTLPTGCYATRPVIIDSIPAPIVGVDSVCTGESSILTNITPAGIWSTSNAAIAAVNAFTGEITGVIPGTVTLSYTIISGCAFTKPFLVRTPLAASVTISESQSLDSLCAGTRITFTAHGINGGIPTYQWQLFGINIDTGSTYTYIPNHGDFITCYMISNGVCSAPFPAMDTVDINVYPLITPMVNIYSNSPNPISYLGQPVTFYSEVSNAGDIVAYQWYEDNVAIPGATNSSYSTEIYYSNSYHCTVTGNPWCAASNSSASNKINITSSFLEAGNLSADKDNLTIFPNPNSGNFTINGTLNGASAATIEISDILGHTIYTRDAIVKDSHLSVSVNIDKSLPSGTYLVRISHKGGFKVFRLLLSGK